MRRNRRNGRSAAPSGGSFGNLYRARRSMMATTRERFPEARFFDPLTLQRVAPVAYAALADIAAAHGRSFAECVFYETFEGVTVAFLTGDPAELRAPEGFDAQSWRVQ